MIFDEMKFSSLLGQINLNSIQIKKISYYMVCFCENFESVVNLWKQYFNYTKTLEDKVAMIYLAHETIEQTARKKNDVFVVAFGDIFHEVFDTLAKTITDVETIKQLVQLIDYWKDRMYYSHNFTSKLKQMLTEKEAVLKKDPNMQLKDLNNSSMLEIIMTNESARINLELAIEERNIKKIYDKIDFDKVNSIVSSIDPPNQITRSYINDFETKIREMRRMLMEDLCKREYYTLQVTEMLNKEKEIFFNLEENKK